MAKNKFFSSLIVVMASNLTTLVSGLLMGLLIPQLMGVENYGHYKIFILYATYASLLHFGFVDGILLKYGGTEERDLDIYEIRANTKFIIYLELLVSLLLLLISLFL